MPIKVAKKGKKYRAVESRTGRIAKNRSGTALDGGGSSSRARVVRQVQAVNINLKRRAGTRIPKRKRRRRK